MQKKIKVNEKLYNEIVEYCEYNNIQDIEKEINIFLRTGFNIEKYNTSPFLSQQKCVVEENVIEENKIVETTTIEPIGEVLNMPIEQNVIKKKKVRIIKN